MGLSIKERTAATKKLKLANIVQLVPPDIDDRQTSSDVMVNEGDDADLVCKANGHPRPTIEWFREDKTHINVVELKFNHSRRLTGQLACFYLILTKGGA